MECNDHVIAATTRLSHSKREEQPLAVSRSLDTIHASYIIGKTEGSNRDADCGKIVNERISTLGGK